jgi:hypothetical protein
VDRLRAGLRAEGHEPLLAGSNWWLPGELAFYCHGQPDVYSLGLALGDRRSQYDLWRPNPVHDPDPFRGRTVILVGPITPALRAAFRDTRTVHIITYEERGQPITCWQVVVCRDFLGFPAQLLPAGTKF